MSVTIERLSGVDWSPEFRSQAWEDAADGGNGAPRRIEIENNIGTVASVATIGATLLSLRVCSKDSFSCIGRDRAGVELTVRQDSSVLPCPAYSGSTCGRVANRIANSEFCLDGNTFKLSSNIPGGHLLHGGKLGFHGHDWGVKEIIRLDDEVGVELAYVSDHLEEGFPGTLQVTCRYTLAMDSAELRILFRARLVPSDDRPNQATVLNVCNHAYWNLSGKPGYTIKDHHLELFCPTYVPVDGNCIPDGTLQSVVDTPFDFTKKARRIGDRLESVGREHGKCYGYDHCLASLPPTRSRNSDVKLQVPKLRRRFGDLDPIEMNVIAILTDPESGRRMTVATTQPGVQVYTSNFMPGTAQHTAVALETQHLPDSPNQPSFPSTVLRPGETFVEATVHVFDT